MGARGLPALAASALLVFPHISNKYLLFLPMIGFGIAWASMMGVPYIIAVAVIPKERYGVYMGIINMMIVDPDAIQTLTFGDLRDLPRHRPGNAIMFAGALLFTAFTEYRRSKSATREFVEQPTAGVSAWPRRLAGLDRLPRSAVPERRSVCEGSRGSRPS